MRLAGEGEPWAVHLVRRIGAEEGDRLGEVLGGREGGEIAVGGLLPRPRGEGSGGAGGGSGGGGGRVGGDGGEGARGSPPPHRRVEERVDDEPVRGRRGPGEAVGESQGPGL